MRAPRLLAVPAFPDPFSLLTDSESLAYLLAREQALVSARFAVAACVDAPKATTEST
jgi:hypothetical protein